MTGPNADSGIRWHVYYSSRTNGSICGLDVDDTSSYGPDHHLPGHQHHPPGCAPGVPLLGAAPLLGHRQHRQLGRQRRLEFAAARFTTTRRRRSSAANDVWTVFELTVGMMASNERGAQSTR